MTTKKRINCGMVKAVVYTAGSLICCAGSVAANRKSFAVALSLQLLAMMVGAFAYHEFVLLYEKKKRQTGAQEHPVEVGTRGRE